MNREAAGSYFGVQRSNQEVFETYRGFGDFTNSGRQQEASFLIRTLTPERHRDESAEFTNFIELRHRMSSSSSDSSPSKPNRSTNNIAVVLENIPPRLRVQFQRQIVPAIHGVVP